MGVWAWHGACAGRERETYTGAHVNGDERRLRVTSSTIARGMLVVLAVWALANLLWLGRDVLFVTLLAVLLGTFISFFAEKLARRRVPRPLAVLAVLAIGGGILLTGGWLLWPALQAQLASLSEQFPEAMGQIAEWAERQWRALTGGPVPDLEEQIRRRFNQEVAGIIGGALPLLDTVVGALIGLVVTVVAGIFAAVEPRTYREGVVRLFPPRLRPRIDGTLTRLADTLRWWMVGTAVSMVLIGVLTTIGLWLLGIPAFGALGLIAGLLQFIPMFGPILGAIPAAAVALMMSPGKLLWVLVFYTGIQLVESNIITPLVMQEAVDLPPALTILFQSLMALVFGFLGLLLAVPILATAMVLVRELYVEPMEAEPGGGG